MPHLRRSGVARHRKRAAVIALGCPKNRVDSEYLLGALARAGYEFTSRFDAGNRNSPDLIILTTCAFLKSAVAESERVLRKLILFKRRHPGTELIVAGCLVQRYGDKLRDRFREVDRWLGLNEMKAIDRLLVGAGAASGAAARMLSTPGHYAYLKIADGCDNRCSYCLIPDIRGGFRSRPMEEIVAEAEALVHLGVKELILIAQDTTLYGRDIYQRPMLGRLIEVLSAIEGVRWLRLMYAHPAHLTEDVIEQFGANPRLCRYIDLPIQHIADRVLERMNRHYHRRDVERLLARLRLVSGMCIRTTVMTGFPGETGADFAQLRDFVSAGHFDRLSGYVFSPEPGTGAYRMPGQIPAVIARERLREIMRIQAQVSRQRLRRLRGTEVTVLVDFLGAGRTEWDAPEIDGVVKLASGTANPGEFVSVLITATRTHDLFGTPLAGR